MLIGLLLVGAAAAVLVGGAELFVESVSGAARRLGVSVFATGLLLAGAEPEELITATYASASGHPGLAAGDAIGANITMFTLALGLAAVISPLPFGPRARRYAVGSVLAGGLALLAVLDFRVSRLEGAGLLAAYVVLVSVVWRLERHPPAIGELAELDSDADATGHGVPGVLAGLALMSGGGVLAVAGAGRVVEVLGRRDEPVGLTLLALATTAELFALVLVAARRGLPEVAVAGVVGSAAYNATATLGAAAVVRPLTSVQVVWPAVLAALLPLLLAAVALRPGRLVRPVGVALVAGYLVFVTYTLR